MYFKKNQVSFAIFFSIVFLLTGSFQLFFVQISAASDRSGGNLSFQIALIFSFLIAFTQFNKLSGFKIKDFNFAAVLPLVLLISICIFSAAWSAEPSVSLRRSFALLLSTMLMFFMAFTLNARQILLVFLYSSFGCALLSFAFSLVPGVGIDNQNTMYDAAWRGLTGHKTDLGKITSIGTVLLFCLLIIEEISLKKFTLMFPIMFFSLIKSESTTALVLAVLCILVLPFFSKIFSSKINSYLRFIKFIFILFLTFIIGYSSFYVAVEFLGKDPTLTGRTVIWEYALTLYELQPFLGYGYRNFWVDANTADFHYFNPYWGEDLMNNGHNGFIDVLLELGLLGFLFYLIFLLKFIWLVTSIKNNDPDSKALVLTGTVLIFFYFIYSVTEQITLDQSDYFWSLLTAVYFSSIRKI